MAKPGPSCVGASVVCLSSQPKWRAAGARFYVEIEGMCLGGTGTILYLPNRLDWMATS